MAKEDTPHNALRAAKNKNGKILYVPKGMDNFHVWDLPDSYNFFEESKDLQEQILFEIAEGKTLTWAAKKAGLPISLVMLMADKDEGFDKALKTAMRYRAETYHDRFANIAEDVTEGTAKSARVKADILRHLMAIGNQDRFGEKKKIQNETATTVTFVVDTGIRRELEDAIPAEGRTIEAKQHGELLEQGSAGTDERVLVVDGSHGLEGVRAVQDEGEAVQSPAPILRENPWADPSRKAGTPPMRQPSVCESESSVPGDEPGQRERQDEEEEALDLQEDPLQARP